MDLETYKKDIQSKFLSSVIARLLKLSLSKVFVDGKAVFKFVDSDYIDNLESHQISFFDLELLQSFFIQNMEVLNNKLVEQSKNFLSEIEQLVKNFFLDQSIINLLNSEYEKTEAQKVKNHENNIVINASFRSKEDLEQIERARLLRVKLGCKE